MLFFVVRIAYWQSCISNADWILVTSLLVPKKVVGAQLFLSFMEQKGSSVVNRSLPLDYCRARLIQSSLWNYFFKIQLNIILPLPPCSPKCSLPSLICVVWYKLQNFSVCSFLYPPVTSCPLCPSVLMLRGMFSVRRKWNGSNWLCLICFCCSHKQGHLWSNRWMKS